MKILAVKDQICRFQFSNLPKSC